jgi:hypothetical protein
LSTSGDEVCGERSHDLTRLSQGAGENKDCKGGGSTRTAVTLAAGFTDRVDTATAKLAGHLVSFAINGTTFTAVTDANGVATVASSHGIGPGIVTVTFAGDAFYDPSSTTAVVGPPIDFGGADGHFAVGDASSALGTTVTFWSSQWADRNQPSAPSSFKGFVSTPAVPPACGSRWTTRPGNSSHPPDKVPAYLAVAVTSKVVKAGSTITGNTTHIAIVKTSPGYGLPGRDGKGTIVAIVC